VFEFLGKSRRGGEMLAKGPQWEGGLFVKIIGHEKGTRS